MSREPVEARLAATLMLGRDGPGGIEVFMVVRHHRIDFATGALVFPGGKVEDADRDPRLRSRCRGAEALSDAALAIRTACVREAFEEAGVLLARERGGEAFVGPDRLATLRDRWRLALEQDHAAMAEMAEAEDLEFATDALTRFAHWVTPEHMPKRFDTHFYLAEAPAAQMRAAAHDGRESVDSVWISWEALRQGQADGRYTVLFPTRLNMEKLARSRTVAEARGAAAAAAVVPVLPEVEFVEGGRIMRIPAEAGYGRAEFRIVGDPGGDARPA
ncbi:MAG: NUDIX domain-containing protein [Alphaproteobacteria bacterium]|nr:NUDIX domain-containing protein [Alphaproteobacteria bacterium]